MNNHPLLAPMKTGHVPSYSKQTIETLRWYKQFHIFFFLRNSWDTRQLIKWHFITGSFHLHIFLQIITGRRINVVDKIHEQAHVTNMHQNWLIKSCLYFGVYIIDNYYAITIKVTRRSLNVSGIHIACESNLCLAVKIMCA